ncbi:unnamed protein product (mitochondrion) [Plasmodiophora brassicae]|uniref:Serine/threonine-protein kinase PLK n=1 Tax=Plasmodiophora brassicae TaxID=37360 RepID=A0A0G4J3U3_PLABS|nr:hypothetical protein PBRA_002319 [Plasmodiophora brassicae]SPQ98909.1 unnamed protein product [Plasmodiophora brassicae]
MATSTATLAPGAVVVERSTGQADGRRYTVGNLLGKGGFAMCYEMTSMDSFKTFAGKVVPKVSLSNSNAKTKLITEIRIHRSLDHPGIVKFHHFFEDPDNVYILLERCKHQTLMEMVKSRGRLTQPEAQYFLAQVIDVLEYLRAQRVIHRDVKLGNLFLHDELRIKMGDFGLAARISEDGERKTTICGTPNYIAPEILENRSGGHSFEVDVWSLGVITFTMLTGKPPFETANLKETYARIRANSYEYPVNVSISASAKDLISKMLVLNPEQRATLAEIRRHPFFTFSKTPTSLPLSALTTNPFEKNHVPSMPNSSSTTDQENIYSRAVRNDLTAAHRAIDSSFVKEPPRNRPSPSWQICTRIVKILNYSNKYGIGYLLSSGAVGVYFNDATKIVLDRRAATYTYYARHDDAGAVHLFGGTVPDDLQKKVTLLQHFHKHLASADCPAEADDCSTVFVRKWASTKRSLLFALSNRVIQVMFADQSELLINNNRIARFTDKDGSAFACCLDGEFGGTDRPDFRRRLEYTRNMLRQMSQ